MALLARVGDTRQTSSCIVARHDVAGEFTVSGDFPSVRTACDPTTDDGVTRIDVAGLVPGRTHAWTCRHSDGSSVSGTLRTHGDRPETFWVGWVYCHVAGSVPWWAPLFRALGCRAVILAGDAGYTNFRPLAQGGLTYDPLADPVVGPYDLAPFYTLHRMMWLQPMLADLWRYIPLYVQEDDHRALGDNHDHTVTQANTTVQVAWAGQRTPGNPQLDVDDHWWTVSRAFRAYYKGNPLDPDYANLAPVKPAAADASTPASRYKCDGFRVDFGRQLRLVVPDLISARSPKAATDDSSKIMLGAPQEARVIADMIDPAFTFSLLGLTKNCLNNRNGDGYMNYKTERDRALNAILSARSRTTSILTGDLHHAHNSRYLASVGQWPRDIYEWAGGPSDPGNQYHQIPTGYLNEDSVQSYIYKAGAAAGAVTPYKGAMAIKVVGDDYLEIWQWGADGRLLCPPARIAAGSNAPTRPYRPRMISAP